MSARIIVGVLALFTIFNPSATAEDKKATKLDGTWVEVAYENFGKVNEIPKAEQGTHTFEQGKLKIKVPALKLDKEGTYAVDDAKKPKHLDLTYKIGDKVQTVQCIYEVSGDTLRIAHPSAGPQGARPTEMKSNTQAQIKIFKRHKG